MDREQAHRILGLYLGASPEHIRQAYDKRKGELSGSGGLSDLDRALAVALGQAPPALSDPRRTRRVRGPLVLLAVVILLVGYTIITFNAGWALDLRQARMSAQRSGESAAAIRDAWRDYREAAGLDPATEADEPYGKARDALEQRSRRAEHHQQAEEWFRDAWQAYAETFDNEAQRLQRAWAAMLADEIGVHLRPYYPFDPEADKEASPGVVTEIFNPVDGAFWKLLEAIRLLEAVAVEGLSPPRVGADPAVIAWGERIRDGLFGESAVIDVRFRVRMSRTVDLTAANFHMGGQTATLNDDGSVEFHWTPENGGANLVVMGSGEPLAGMISHDYRDHAWGVLRVFGHLEPVRDDLSVWHMPFAIPGPPGLTSEYESVLRLRLDTDRAEVFRPGALAWPAQHADE